jgi:predicted Ser/Thr protein kinase
MEELTNMETTRICPNCRKPLPPDMPLGLCPECLIKSGLPTGTEPGAAGEGTGGRFVPPPVGELAQLFPQLEILSFIGKGGMGAVYKARQPALERFVALKILPPAVAGDPGFAERFNREARALARLNHPNIVAVYDFGKAGALHYLLMEFVDGSNLREVEQAGRLSPEQAVAIVPQICEALQFAHNEGVVHRDIKPENILLDKKGRVKIADFGIAKMVGVPAGQISLTGAQDVMGTPHYMAPEQIEKPQTVDHRADIYSLGVVFYEMLTGELPLGKFAPPSKKVQMDVRLDEVVLHTLEKEPERRYQHASQVKTDVEAITSVPAGARPDAVPPSVPPTTATAGARSDKIILPAFLLAFFFGVFGAHRFYVGKIWTAFLQLAALGGCVILTMACATFGKNWEPVTGILLAAFICGCLIWATVDWILILCKVFTDGEGRRITNWFDPNASEPKPDHKPSGGGPPSPPIPSGKPSGDRMGMIVAPAAGLMVAGLWKLLSALTAFGWLGTIFGHFGIHLPFHLGGLVGFSVVMFKIIPALVILFGAIQMMEIRNYAWAVAAAIVAIISCSLIGFPIGIWALIVLMRADVRETFANRSNSPLSTTLKWSAVAAAAIVILFTLSLFIRQASKSWGETDEPNLSSLSNLSKLSKLSRLSEPFMSWDEADKPAQPMRNTSNSAPLQNMPETNPGLAKGSLVGANKINQVIEVGAEAKFSKSLLVEPGGKLTMKVDRGSVNVTGSDQNTVEIQVDRKVTRADDSEATRMLKEERLVLKQTGNDVSITTHEPPSFSNHSFWGWLSEPNLNVHYEITLPRKFDVRLETSGGRIKVASLHGNADVKTEGGSLDFNDIDGRVNGQTEGGGIRAVSCKNELLIQTQGGGITIERFTGSRVRATTEGGSVSADFAAAPKADCELRTEGGSVTARLPGSAAVTLDAHSDGGSVRTDLPVQVQGQFHNSTLKGTINGGGPLLKLATEGGNIEVLKQ